MSLATIVLAAMTNVPVNAAAQTTGIPLAAYEQGQAIAQAAMAKLSPDLRFTFLDKTYENDQYASVLGNKVRTACVRFKASSGFTFRSDPPTFKLTNAGLRVQKRIGRIDANGLTYRFQLGPCADIAAGFGVRLSDVVVTYEARPILQFDTQGACRVRWNEDPDSLRVAIGDVNIIGVQNDIDKLAKDAAREAVNRLFKTFFEALRNDFTKISVNVCGNQKQR
jgi:hypothetical protein